MPIVRADIEATLSRVDASTLRMVLEAAELNPRGAETSRELAERIADALWWHYSSPLGYLADQTTLEDIVGHVARKVGVNGAVDVNQDGWHQLNQLTRAMFRSLPTNGVSLLDLDEVTRSKIEPSWMPTVGFGVGSGSSVGTAWASGKALGWLRGPLGRLIPLIPPLAPYYKLIVSGLGAVRLVAWPLGIAFAVLSVNSALGANERKLVPLLLGVGALGPEPVREADIITLDVDGELPDPV
ncbi:MAG: hypothetical protein R3F61_07320 [Myxococcota bacterium]